MKEEFVMNSSEYIRIFDNTNFSDRKVAYQMKWHHRFFSSVLFAMAKAAAHLPLRILYLKAGVLRFIAEKILRYRYDVIIQNLSRSFPEKNYKEIKALAHEFYRHFFEIFAEIIKSQGLRPEEAKARFHIENPELIDDYHRKGINVIAMAGHRGNWEWVIMMPLFFNFSIYTLYKPLSGKVMEHLMGRIRKRFGMKLLPMQQAGRFILSKKDYPALYLFVGDQSPSHKDPDYSFEFLNQPSLMFTGGAKLAKATASAVVYFSVNKVKRGFYSVKFTSVSEPQEMRNDQEILRLYVKMLEEDIQHQPAFWLWSHKRWKHKAKGN